MPCLIAAMLFGMPRLVIVLMALFSDYIGTAYSTWLWPLLGFFFMPYTTIAYAVAQHAGGGAHGLWMVLVVVAVLFDIGVIGHGSRAAGKKGKVAVR